jgi:hypothetical protein
MGCDRLCRENFGETVKADENWKNVALGYLQGVK